MSETELKLDPIRKEVEKLSREQMIEELTKWRGSIGNIAKMTRELAQFRTFAQDADQLAEKLSSLGLVYQAEIEKRDVELNNLTSVLKGYADDPIGIGFKIDQMTANSRPKQH